MKGRGGRRAPAALGLVLAALAAVAPGAPGVTIERVGPVASGYGLMATADGGVARLLSYDEDAAVNAQRLQRIDRRGRVRTFRAPRGVLLFSGSPAVLTDGSLAFEGVQLYDDAGRLRNRAPHVLVAFPHRGSVRAVPLSGSSGDASWSPTAIAPDGAAWRARVCSGLLSRTAPNGGETRIHLPPVHCRAEVVEGYDSAFAFGPDGAVWFASLCQAWIARVALVGRPRMWRLSRRPGCESGVDDFEALRPQHPRLLATRDGGLRFENGGIDAHGRLRLDRSGLPPDAIGPDGAEWRVGARAIVRRGRDGRVTRTRVSAGVDPYGDAPRQFTGGTVGPDGRLWYLSAVPVDELSLGWHTAFVHVGAVDAHGRAVDRALPPEYGADIAGPVAGAGAVWLNDLRAALRVAVRPSRADRREEATATRFLARRGATVWIQLRCRAAPGTFCSNLVSLDGSDGRVAVHRARFAIPAGEARAVPFRLTARALKRLGRAGRLDAFADVQDGGGGVRGWPIHVR